MVPSRTFTLKSRFPEEAWLWSLRRARACTQCDRRDPASTLGEANCCLTAGAVDRRVLWGRSCRRVRPSPRAGAASSSGRLAGVTAHGEDEFAVEVSTDMLPVAVEAFALASSRPCRMSASSMASAAGPRGDALANPCSVRSCLDVLGEPASGPRCSESKVDPAPSKACGSTGHHACRADGTGG